MSFHTIFAGAREHPSKSAVVYNGIAISYAAFARAIADTISHLEARGHPTGGTVAVDVSNLLDCWVAVLALQAVGLHTVCIKSPSMIETLELNDVVGLVTTEGEPTRNPFENDAGAGDSVIRIPNPIYKSEDMSLCADIDRNMKNGGHILYTSGTTGNYKKVFMEAELQHQRNAEKIQSYLHCQADTVYHCLDFGLWTAVGYKWPLYNWQMGGCIILEQRPRWYQYFLQSGLTNALLLPDQVHQLLGFLENQPSKEQVEDFYLIVAGGFISRKLAEQLLNCVSGYLENLYGSTEVNVPVLRSRVTSLHVFRA